MLLREMSALSERLDYSVEADVFYHRLRNRSDAFRRMHSEL